MPHNAPKVKVRAIESYGGKITYCEPTIESRETICANLVASSGSISIHPYDNDRIIAGQGTAALELLEEVPDLDFISRLYRAEVCFPEHRSRRAECVNRFA